ncbi:MAG: hypothetical protein ABSG27_13520 [Candidatus Acidiferrales bacterium]|jgi:hypothetical protein
MATQTRGALTPAQEGAIYRAQKADDFRAICAHLQAARDMIIGSDLDASEILCLFSNADIPVFPIIVQSILAARHVRQLEQNCR